MRKQPKIGLALGAGGARGWAHIGVIDAIRDCGIDIHCVAGTSMGALVGAAFASGKIDALHKVALDLDWKQLIHYFVDISLPRSGLIDGTRIVEFVREYVMATDITELQIPFAAIATDVLTGKEIVQKKGSILDAVRASIAIPGVFTPLVRGDYALVDGGLVNPLPINIARALGADFVIAVDITRAPLSQKHREDNTKQRKQQHRDELIHRVRSERTRKLLERLSETMESFDLANLSPARKWPWSADDEVPNIFEVLGNTMRIFQRQITAMRLQLDPPNVLIQPAVQEVSTMDFHHAEVAIKAGYDAAQTALKLAGLTPSAAS